MPCKATPFSFRYFSTSFSLAMVVAFVPVMLPVSTVHAAEEQSSADSFILRDIQIDGLVRMLPTEVINFLPMTTGDTVNSRMMSDSVKTLYKTGKFDNISVRRSGNVLVYTVVERPRVLSVDFKGNKKVKKDDLVKGAKAAGLAAGESFRPDVVDDFTREVETAYAEQGYYDAKVKVETIARPNNQVDVLFNVTEGTPSKVVKINIIGNTVLSDREIKRIFLLKENSRIPIIGKDGSFSRAKLEASKDALKNAYMNKGYLKVEIVNSQTSVGADNKKVYVDVTVNEGKRYSFSGASFVGDTVFKDDELVDLLQFKAGDTFSQLAVVETQKMLSRKYANSGYYMVQIRPVPQIDDANAKVSMAFFINAGKPVMVRRIYFVGNANTSEKVLRHHLRQMESSLASQDKIELSKARMMRTGFFKSVDYSVSPVSGQDDQIDLTFKVEETQTGQTSFTVGYSGDYGVTYQFGLSQDNFMGSGRNVGINFERNQVLDNYSINVTNPYFTIDGVTQGYSLYYRKTKAATKNISNYLMDIAGGSYSLGYPLNEYESISASLALDQTGIRGNSNLSANERDFLLKTGGTATEVYTKGTDAATANINISKDTFYDAKYLDAKLGLNWSYNSLDRPLFPKAGQKHVLSLTSTLPGSDLDYQKATVSSDIYFPLWKDFVIHGYTKIGAGRDLPFFQNFYAGGFGSVRGFRYRTLGPRQSWTREQVNQKGDLTNTGVVYCGQPAAATGNSEAICGKDAPAFIPLTDPYPKSIGGQSLVQAGAELAIPLPFKADWTDKFRLSLFYDAGNVFDGFNEFDRKELRYSYGAGFTWMTFIGPISWHYAVPINPKKNDQLKRTDFTIGMMF